MLGATESRTHNGSYIWGYAALWHAISWWFMSKACRLALTMARGFRFGEADFSYVVIQADIEALLDGLEAAYRIERSSPVINGNPDNGPIASSSGAAVSNNDITSGLRLRRRAKAVELPLRLFEENTACPLANDVKATAKSLEDRGNLFKRGISHSYWHADSTPVAGAYASVFSTSKKQAKVTLREAWLESWRHNPNERNIQLLRNLYGLEISACTGNARRVSIVDLMMTASFRPLLRSFPWSDPLCRQTIMEIIEDHDVDGFINFYIENPDWREDIGPFITACLDILDQTGVDRSARNLIAFRAHGEDPMYVEFPFKLYHWAQILIESTQTVTMAVITNICLSA
ncbi:uncharacterized protein K444DRAFT_392793 [Hyaloscypha bicolor E]|uniref:Uncharacterized protein n=1 Tax=Hyaloscypha bicolor E TaxID=1095630 RepID=A0A2J6TBM8_9HELO|nr:uncharacterized protein K444DRAFT_392793 [Hyaloscypha bicolor E]PMD60439.1 hypothetical protein K444DRAFT_392793 [Hyaloscypha bicolor E]